MDYMDENEEIFRAWIGEKNQNVYWEKLKKGGFNFLAFLLPDLMLITRKMWLEYLIFILIFIGYIFLPIDIPMIFAVGLRIAFGFFYYPLYRNCIRRKIEKCKKQGVSYERQLEIARQRGGDKITLIVVLAIVLEIILIVMLGFGYNAMYEREKKDVNNSNSDSIRNKTLEQVDNEAKENAHFLDESDWEEGASPEKNTSEENNLMNAYNTIFKTISKNGVFIKDNWKIKYNSDKWNEVEVPTSLDAKGILKSSDNYLLCYINNSEIELNFLDKEQGQAFVKLCELAVENAHNMKPETQILKIDNSTFYLAMKVEELYEVSIIKQKEKTCDVYVYYVINLDRNGFAEERINEIKNMFKNMEFLK